MAAVQPAEPLWRRHAWRILALWVLVLAAYAGSFRAGLVFDNASIVSEDARIRAVTPHNIQLILTEGYWYRYMPSGLYRPLTTFSYLLNYSVLGNGSRPAGYHWVNFALHGVNVSLVYFLGMFLLGSPLPALALAALWGLHPLLTESVTNIVGRADLLAAFGVLAGLLWYVRGAPAAGPRRLAWLAGLAAAQAAGLFSKESAAVLPGIMLLYDLTWPGRMKWRDRVPAYAALIVPFAAFFYLRAAWGARLLAGSAPGTALIDIVRFSSPLGFWTARFTAVKVIGKYLWLYLWPAGLSADYSYNAVPLFGWRPANWEDAKALVALAVCLAAAWLAVVCYRTRKPLFFFLVFFFVALAPTSNLLIQLGEIMAERFVYLPAVGLAGCAVVGIDALGRMLARKWPAAPRAAWCAAGLVCLAFAARTYARNSDWRDEISLWRSAVRVCPENFRAHYNLGVALAQPGGQWAEAIEEYRATLRLMPDLAEAHNNLGFALSHMPGRMPEAMAEYQAALRLKPDLAEAHYDLGVTLSRMPGRLRDAIAEYETALRIKPDYAEAHNDLGVALSKLPGRMPDAVAEFQMALRARPDLAEAHYDLGAALSRMPGRMPEAIAEYQAALRGNPDYAEAHNKLGLALSQMPGRMPEAIAEYQAALRTKPDLAEAHNNFGIALSQMPGRLPDAIAEYEAALRIEPDYAQAHNDLGIALSQMPGRLPAAVAEFQAAVRLQPDLAEAHCNLGVALSRIGGREAEALAAFQAAVRARPDYAEAHNNLGLALSHIPGRLPDAIAEYRTALRINPDLAEGHRNLGNALTRMPGRLPEAIAAYQAALRIRPDPEIRKLLDQLQSRR